jgi:hypothetical protein
MRKLTATTSEQSHVAAMYQANAALSFLNYCQFVQWYPRRPWIARLAHWLDHRTTGGPYIKEGQ